MPSASARARSGATAEVASGNRGTAASFIGPKLRMNRLTMPRAGRPVNRLVSAVWRAASLCSAARCTALVLASGHSRYAVPTCTPAAPSAIAAATPAASAMPPAAITGTRTAATTCGSSAKVPICRVRSSERKWPRCPPASSPCAMTASTPCASSQRASSTVVADDSTLAPQPRTRASSSGDGRPKWKLTTGGANAASNSAVSASNGRRPGPAGIAAGSMPNSA